ncbi:MAG: hypothetical protein Tsb0021_12590 [Chlamydiales bacterium]
MGSLLFEIHQTPYALNLRPILRKHVIKGNFIAIPNQLQESDVCQETALSLNLTKQFNPKRLFIARGFKIYGQMIRAKNNS